MAAPAAPRGGRAVAWVGFVFGSVMSTAANVLYTWIPPEHASADWHPTAAAQIGAAVWPIALLLSVEVLARVLWPSGLLWALARYGGTGLVAAGSAVISYGHLHGVLEAWHYGGLGAAVGPLVLDGLMVVSGFALLAPATPPAAGVGVSASPAQVARPALNPQSRPGRVEPPAPAPDVPTPPVKPRKPQRTEAEKQAAAERSARSRRHKADDHTLCLPERCPDAPRVRAA